MANEPNEPTVITEPYYTLAPENFRRLMQQQIKAAITKQVNGIYGYKMGELMDDARFGNRPGTVVAMSNEHNFPYFIVGATPVDDIHVAHP